MVVFADVLEHLRDPVAVLRRASKLLAPGGSVVISIPNVAHGSVRLSLLEGRFDYRPLGLLDDTHLRFFTRSSLEAMLGAAGFSAVDVRRTTADAFATEIPLDASRFAPELVDRVRSDPDAFTYQFVLRAAPDAELSAADKLELLAARSEELEALGAQVREILDAGRGFVAQPAVAVLTAPPAGPAGAQTPWRSLRASVAVGELRRRLHDTTVRLVSADPDPDPDGSPDDVDSPKTAASQHASPATDLPASDWAGEPVEHLGGLADSVAGRVAHDFDAVVAVDADGLSDGLARVAAYGCPIKHLAGRENANVPDLLVVAERVGTATSMPARLAYLRATKALPGAERYMVVSVGTPDKPRLRAIARVVAQLASDAATATGEDTAVWVLPAPEPYADPAAASVISSAVEGSTLLDALGEVDLLAVFSGAELVVTDAGPPAALALSMRRPLLCVEGDPELSDLARLAGDPDLVTAKPADLLALAQIAVKRASDEQLTLPLATAVDFAFDDLAGSLERSAARRLAASLPEALDGMRRRISHLERANAASARRIAAERNALGRRAIALSGGAGSDETAAEMLVALAERKREEAEEAARAATEALEAVMATKTMRVLSPARRVYGQLRGGLR
ncbi:MAG: methyltransferase domain-containing protein [Acidimicrobiales bacterium]